MSSKSAASSISGGGGVRTLLRHVSSGAPADMHLVSFVYLFFSIPSWVNLHLTFSRLDPCLALFQRPVDWLEEADRQLYLTTPSTGNNHDSRQRRRIDFVLVYSLGVRDTASNTTNKLRRQAFQRKLESVGFEIEEQDIVGGLVMSRSLVWRPAHSELISFTGIPPCRWRSDGSAEWF